MFFVIFCNKIWQVRNPALFEDSKPNLIKIAAELIITFTLGISNH